MRCAFASTYSRYDLACAAQQTASMNFEATLKRPSMAIGDLRWVAR
jgi:hypothetical protein